MILQQLKSGITICNIPITNQSCHHCTPYQSQPSPNHPMEASYSAQGPTKNKSSSVSLPFHNNPCVKTSHFL